MCSILAGFCSISYIFCSIIFDKRNCSRCINRILLPQTNLDFLMQAKIISVISLPAIPLYLYCNVETQINDMVNVQQIVLPTPWIIIRLLIIYLLLFCRFKKWLIKFTTCPGMLCHQGVEKLFTFFWRRRNVLSF